MLGWKTVRHQFTSLCGVCWVFFYALRGIPKKGEDQEPLSSKPSPELQKGLCYWGREIDLLFLLGI